MKLTITSTVKMCESVRWTDAFCRCFWHSSNVDWALFKEDSHESIVILYIWAIKKCLVKKKALRKLIIHAKKQKNFPTLLLDECISHEFAFWWRVFPQIRHFFVPGLMFMINNRSLRESVWETFYHAFIYYSFYAQILFIHILKYANHKK